MNFKIFIAGGACSGKSTLAKAIADHTGYPVASFGDILREHARMSNLSLSIESLQNLGQGLISQLGYDGFLQWIIVHSHEVPWQSSIVLDGVRHKAMHESLKKAFPASILVYCVCHRDTQIERMMNRDGVSREEALHILSHPLEQFIGDLEQQSDLFFHPEDSLKDFLGKLDALIKQQQ